MKTSRGTRVMATLIGVLLIGSGVSKLAGESHQVASFLAWGLPSWFRLLVGTFEVGGGLLLIIPATTPLGSVVLGTIMVGALWTHLAFAEWPHLAPVLVVLTLLAWVFRQTRARVIHLLGGA